MRKAALYCLLFSCIVFRTVQAQTKVNETNNMVWFRYNGEHKISAKIGIHAEVQIRRTEFVRDWSQLLFRPGINYYMKGGVMLNAGYAFFNNTPYGEYPTNKYVTPEHRIWERLTFKSNRGKIDVENRFTLEQRWVGVTTGNDKVSAWKYKNRIRYMLQLTVPIMGKLNEKGSFYFNVGDELFIGFGSNVGANVFDQNRISSALGYCLGKIGKLEVGAVLQQTEHSDGYTFENNYILQVSLMSNLDLYRKKEKQQESQK